MRILKFKSQPTIAFFAAVNHRNGPLRELNFTSLVQKQARNMVYGLRAQSPKYDWDQSSEERAQGSEGWDQGSQGF